jgi:hypothetical protein
MIDVPETTVVPLTITAAFELATTLATSEAIDGTLLGQVVATGLQKTIVVQTVAIVAVTVVMLPLAGKTAEDGEMAPEAGRTATTDEDEDERAPEVGRTAAVDEDMTIELEEKHRVIGGGMKGSKVEVHSKLGKNSDSIKERSQEGSQTSLNSQSSLGLQYSLLSS